MGSPRSERFGPVPTAAHAAADEHPAPTADRLATMTASPSVTTSLLGMVAPDLDPPSPFEPTVLGAMWRYWWVVVVSVLVCGGLALGSRSRQTTVWVAEAALVVEDPRAAALFDQGALLRPERYVENQIEIIRSTAVAQRASELASNLDARELRAGLSAGMRGTSDLITISFRRPDADTAVEGANAVALAYQDVRRSEAVRSFSAAVAQLETSMDDIESELAQVQDEIDELRRSDPVRDELDQQYQETLAELAALQRAAQVDPDELTDVQSRLEATQLVLGIEAAQPRLAALLEEQRQAIDRLSELTTRRDQLRVDAELAGGSVVFFSPADRAFESGGNTIRVLGVGVVFGGLVGAGLAYLLALRRQRFTQRSEPELVLGVALLGEIPEFREERLRTPLPARDAPLSAAAEAARFVVAALALRGGREVKGAQHDPRSLGSVAITSARLRDGKTAVLTNVAVAATFQGYRVLVIDADFGHQNATDTLLPDMPPGPGLTEVVTGSMTLDEAAARVEIGQPGELWVLSRGRLPITAPDFFNSEQAMGFILGVRDDFDLVLVDTPPVLQVAYASALVGSVDRVVVVVPHASSIQPAHELRQRLELIGTPVAGYVYNRAPAAGLPPGEGSLADVLGTIQTEPTRRFAVGRKRRRGRIK